MLGAMILSHKSWAYFKFLAAVSQILASYGRLISDRAEDGKFFSRIQSSFFWNPVESIGTPIVLNRIIKIDKPNTRVYYNLHEIGLPDLGMVPDDFVKKHITNNQ